MKVAVILITVLVGMRLYYVLRPNSFAGFTSTY